MINEKQNDYSVFGNGELFEQLEPLFIEDGIKISKVYDDLEMGAESVNDAIVNEKQVLYLVGYKNMKARTARFHEFKERGVQFASWAASNATLSTNVAIGMGTLINQKTVLDNFVTIGECCFLNIGVSISHHTTIGNCVIIAPRAAVAGRVVIEDNVFIGTNATIIDHITVGENSIVAAGAVVIDDVPPNTMVAGNPARIKKHLDS